MSRSRNRRKPRRKPGAASPSATGAGSASEAQARQALTSGRHKTAIAAYKALLKQEQRPHWSDGLAQAYEGRAVELSNKGMFKEAVAIWEQRAQLCEKSPADPRYIIWLLHAGRDEPAIQMFRDAADALDAATDLATLREHLAAFALAGHTRIVELLPADDPVVRDYGPTCNALRAYCDGDEQAFEVSLKAIPFRSPYRDFRQLLKAMQLQERNAEGAFERLERIAGNSPFAGLAALLRDVARARNKNLDTLAKLDQEGLRLAATVHGWSEAHLSQLRAAASLGPSPNARSLFEFVMRYRQAIGESNARTAAMNLLIDYPAGLRLFNKQFSVLSDFDHARLDALIAERNEDPYTADRSWRDALGELYEALDEGNNRLRAALILRRCAEPWLPQGDAGQTDPSVLEDLGESLRLDPDDVATHVRLIAGHRQARQMKLARSGVKAALQRFPQDTGILLEAVQTAIAGDAFKKAAGYASTLLSIDPINVKVQDILLNAHVGHARKQIKAGKYAPARRELEAASRWIRSAAAQGKISIAHGLLELGAGDSERARQLLREGRERLGGGLVGQFQMLLEATRLFRDPRTMLKQAQLSSPSELASCRHVLDLMRALSSMAEDEKKWVGGALEPIADALHRATAERFSRPEMAFICDTLHRCQQSNLLSAYAEQAIARWPDCPVFVFHQLYAKSQGLGVGLNGEDMNRLGEALTQAERDGDMRTMHRISEFIDDQFPFRSPTDWSPFEDPTPAINDIASELGMDGMAEILAAIEDAGDAEAFIRDLVNGRQSQGRRQHKKKRKTQRRIPKQGQGELPF